MFMKTARWIWASTFIWFLEPVPRGVTPWRFWTRLVLWTPIVYLLILPICVVLALLAIGAMIVCAGLSRFRHGRAAE